jgi:hypothetical protein
MDEKWHCICLLEADWLRTVVSITQSCCETDIITQMLHLFTSSLPESHKCYTCLPENQHLIPPKPKWRQDNNCQGTDIYN